jgi:hypothetical protein
VAHREAVRLPVPQRAHADIPLGHADVSE